MVVVPLTMTLLDVAAPMSVVVALAMVCVGPVEGAGHGVASFGDERACDSGLQCLNFGLCSGEVVANVRR